MRRLDAPPEAFAVEIAPGVWPQIGVVPAAVFGNIRRALQQLAETIGREPARLGDSAVPRTCLLNEGDYVASYTVNTITRRVTLTGIGRRMNALA